MEKHTYQQLSIPPKGTWRNEDCEICNEHWSSDQHFKSTCEHGVTSPNRFKYCGTCRDNAAAHF